MEMYFDKIDFRNFDKQHFLTMTFKNELNRNCLLNIKVKSCKDKGESTTFSNNSQSVRINIANYSRITVATGSFMAI